MSNLYEDDILIWSEQQAEQLRRHAAGANDPALDWPNIIEEIESVGRSQLSAVRSLLTRALSHMLKCEAWPLSGEVPGWHAEAIRFRQEALEAYTPSMRQRLDMTRIYTLAVRQLPETIDGQPPLPIPDVCPVTLDELLSDQP